MSGYTEGDVNHNVQPIIGWLRLLENDGEPLSVERMALVVDRLRKACDAEKAWLTERDAARAEALRDVADAWQQGGWTEITGAVKSGNPIAVGQRVTDWLRARAEVTP